MCAMGKPKVSCLKNRIVQKTIENADITNLLRCMNNEI